MYNYNVTSSDHCTTIREACDRCISSQCNLQSSKSLTQHFCIINKFVDSYSLLSSFILILLLTITPVTKFVHLAKVLLVQYSHSPKLFWRRTATHNILIYTHLHTVIIVFHKAPTEAETEELSRSAALLYGLIHARYIITSHGLESMVSQS